MMWLTGTQTQVLQAAMCVFSLANDLVIIFVLIQKKLSASNQCP